MLAVYLQRIVNRKSLKKLFSITHSITLKKVLQLQASQLMNLLRVNFILFLLKAIKIS